MLMVEQVMVMAHPLLKPLVMVSTFLNIVIVLIIIVLIFIFLNVFTDNIGPKIITDYIVFIPQRAGAGWFLGLPFLPTGVAEFVAAHTSHMVATLCEFNHVLAFDTLAP